MANPNLECRMYPSRYPKRDMLVMIQVNTIDDKGASVSLLEFNHIEGRIDDPSCRELTVVGRIEPVVVLSVDVHDDKVSIHLSKTNMCAEDKYFCESRYNKNKYVQLIMREVARTLAIDLENVYISALWPSYDTLTTQLDKPRSTYWKSLPSNLKNALRDKLNTIIVKSWRLMNPGLLSPGFTTPSGRIILCWAFALIRQFEAVLKINDMIEMDTHLSVQDLVNKTPRSFLDDVGDIDDLEDAVWALSVGIVAEEHCPLTFTLDVKGSTTAPDVPVHKIRNIIVYRDYEVLPEIWDKNIEEAVLVAPVAAAVLWFGSYNLNRGGKEVYRPTDDEWSAYEADNTLPHLPVHVMLLTGYVTDKHGTKLWEFQDNGGDVDNGDRGYLYFARHPNLIIEYVELEV